MYAPVSGNGRTLTKTYDQDYVIDRVASSVTEGLRLDFDVDVMGNIVGAVGVAGETNRTSPPEPRRYVYDALYRLRDVTPAAPATGAWESYTYNRTGDRLSAQRNSDPVVSYGYAAGTHRLVSVDGAARTYDANGNTRTGIAAGLTLSYEDRNRLASSVKTGLRGDYAHNGRGERVGKIATKGSGSFTVAEPFIYAYDEAGHQIGEYGEMGNAIAEYVYLDDVPIAIVRNGMPSYVETDHLGTPRLVVNATTNAAKWTWDFFGGAFGTNASDESPGGLASYTLNLRFPGQYYDAETGLNYNYQRYYESGTGRYTSSDRIGPMGGINTYGYVGGQPLTRFDPTGLLAPAAPPPIAPPPAPPTGIWSRILPVCRVVIANPIVATIVGIAIPNSTGGCDQPNPPPGNNCPKSDSHVKKK